MAYNVVNSLYEDDILSKREGQLILHALEDVALTNVNMDLRNM